MEIPLSEVNESLIEELALLAPFGPDNPQPIFTSRNVYLKNEPRRIAKSGFKMWVTTGDRIMCEAISFRRSGMSMPPKGAKIDLVYSPSINTWQGVSTLQLDLKDLKLVEERQLV